MWNLGIHECIPHHNREVLLSHLLWESLIPKEQQTPDSVGDPLPCGVVGGSLSCPSLPHVWIHQVRELGTLDSPSSITPLGTRGYPEPAHPLQETRNSGSQPWRWRPSQFCPLPPTWRMECDTRRGPAARREGLRSSSVAALKGGDAAATTGTAGGGEGGQAEAAVVRMGVGREPREPVRLPITPDGGGPSLQPLVSCFSPSPLSPLPPANFQPVGAKAWGPNVRARVCLCVYKCFRVWMVVQF